MAKKTYPLRETVLGLDYYTRIPVQGVNLRSCELLHPKITAILANHVTTDTNHFQLYPFPQTTINYIADYLHIPRERLTLSAGSDPIISIIIEALGTISGRMILQTPNYFGWQDYAKLRGLTTTPYFFGQPSQHTFCLSALLQLINTQAPSLVVISNPNSPTGYTFKPDEILCLVNACEERGHLLIIDECFAAFANINHYEIIGLQEHVVIIRSYSKVLGLAGTRIALTIASKKITEYLARWRPDAAVSGSALHMLASLINKEAELREIYNDIANTREKFVAGVKKINPAWIALPSEANFINFYLPKNEDPAFITAYLQQYGYVIRNVSALPGLESCLRFGIAHWDIMQDLLNTLNQLGLST